MEQTGLPPMIISTVRTQQEQQRMQELDLQERQLRLPAVAESRLKFTLYPTTWNDP